MDRQRFQPSTLSKDQQMAEMKWFIDAAKKLQAKGVKEIAVVSETITTHEYEIEDAGQGLREITGIRSSTTSSRKATSSRSCRPRCSPAESSTTAGSATPT